jgi:hypothetical protein
LMSRIFGPLKMNGPCRGGGPEDSTGPVDDIREDDPRRVLQPFGREQAYQPHLRVGRPAPPRPSAGLSLPCVWVTAESEERSRQQHVVDHVHNPVRRRDIGRGNDGGRQLLARKHRSVQHQTF